MADLVPIAAEAGLTASQIPIWIGQAMHPSSALYNMAFAFVLDGAVDEMSFAAAWRRLVAASDALRTSIVVRDARPHRHIREDAPVESQVLDFTAHRDPLHAFRTWALERCARALPLDGWLVDSILARLGRARYGWYLNQHHLITDASSTVLLVRQFAAEYQALRGEGPSPAPLMPYYPGAASLASPSDLQASRAASQHWDRRRQGNRSPDLYGRASRPSSTASERLTVRLDHPASRRLQEIATEPGFLGLTADVSMFNVFATLLSAWIWRTSGAAQITFDAPSQNRPTRDAKRALGVFIDMLPYAVTAETADSFRTLGGKCLVETREYLRAALPGASASSVRGAGSIVLNFFPGSFGAFAGVPMTADWLHPGESDGVHAVRLHVHDFEGAGRYTLQFDLNHDVFPAAGRRRAVQHFERLLDACLRDPDQSVAAVDILGDDERQAIVRFNDTGRHPSPSASVIARFHEQALRTPDAVAVREGNRVIPFDALRRDVLAAASSLKAAGVEAGEAVGLVATRSADTVVAMLSLLQARAVYVPLDPGAPPERIERLLRDCGASRVLAGERWRSPIDTSAVVVRVGDLVARGADGEIDMPRLADRAYIMYTSGSTGAPKGVVVSHAGLAAYLEWASRTYVRGERLAFPLFTPLTFDLTVTSLYLPLLTGGTLVIYRETESPADAALMDVIADDAVDAIKLTPSHLSLLRHLDLARTRIRRLIVGGEDFRTSLATDVTARFARDVEIYNEYGPTEAVVGCMVHRYDPAAEARRSVPIGCPADHVRLYVVNEAMALVPEGVPGELCISRYGLAEGYHGMPEATARQFVSSPFDAGDRLYHSGDLVRFADSHTLEYLGRMDRQLKVSGVRIEPGEIEAAVLDHPAVTACAVIEESTFAKATVDRSTIAKATVDGPTSDMASPITRPDRYCAVCGLPSNYPGTTFDSQGVCSVCRSFESIKSRAGAYFRTLDDLRAEIAAARRQPTRFDCLLLLSGGKDSTYALCRLVDMGLRVYAFSFDNGYIASGATENIRRVVAALGVDHEFATAPDMPAIFRDSLMRFSNVCNGCFKVIYTLGISRARGLGIPVVITGLSRGQLFETRLTPDLFRDGFSPEEVDAAVLAARKAYHRADDEVARRLDVSVFGDDRVFEEVRVLDFYRYCDAGLDEVFAYLASRVPWLRPSDTGRSTNCLANDVGIYVHTRERGYHNYALPYSWDVRLGHKTRQQAVEELQDELDVSRVRRILGEIKYAERRDPRQSNGLVACYVAPHEVDESALRQHVSRALPPTLVPARFARVEAIPLTANGKIDEVALHALAGHAARQGEERFVAPAGPVQEGIAGIFSDVLQVPEVGARTSLFGLGGTSLAAMEIALRICREFEVDLPLQSVFALPTVAQLADRVEELIVQEVASLSDEEAERRASEVDGPP